MGDQDIGLDVESVPRVGMKFNSEIKAYKFYNSYGGIFGFSVRKGYAHWKRTDKSILISRKFVCSKQGFRGKDKRDIDTSIPRAETRTNCSALMGIVRVDNGEYKCTKFVEEQSHPLHLPATLHMMRSQRKISDTCALEIDLADDSGMNPKSIFDLMSKQSGGRDSIGYIRQDQKNYLRTKHERDLSYGEAGCLLIFDTTFCTNKEYRPFGVFVGFNYHRCICIFGAALLYDETSESFRWLFEAFMKVHGQKKPLTIFTDQDAAIGNAISEFFKHFERVVKDKRYNELKEKFDAKNKTPRNIFPMSPIMLQALQVYTPVIFTEFQDEYIWITACFIKFRIESIVIHDYIVSVVNREGDFNVKCNPVGPTITCSCRKFETYGILCCHALKIFDVLDIKFIPANYLLKRWTRGARNIIAESVEGARVEEDVNLDYTQHYRLLCPKLVRIASEASNSSEGYALVDRVANDLCAQLQNLAVVALSRNPSSEYTDVNIGLKKKSPRKGGKRYKSWVEKQGKQRK
ncbi:protein FAR1-RELATED SEQUENCE 5-like [Macadamia integrifolia]|uniref:protein FAR1-RELATED SEQUENCE 5-like n=1 Tax=Macadamia integrifolia TaxID=60698 RepID=UPI001C527F5F|nr:protein FAR1-RELATED SEQUENCE 5-like [Macadamia integrifolia]